MTAILSPPGFEKPDWCAYQNWHPPDRAGLLTGAVSLWLGTILGDLRSRALAAPYMRLSTLETR
jgi:hypothetical protein